MIWNRNAPLTLLRNDMVAGGPGADWIEFQGPLGTRVTAAYGPAGMKQSQAIVSQSSFYSAPGRTLHFGLGSSKTVDLIIRWPNGKTEVRKSVPAGRIVR